MAELDERNDSRPRQVPEPAETRTGMAKFLGLSLAIWAIVIVLAVVFLTIILVFAL